MRYRVLVLPLSPRRTPTVPRDPLPEPLLDARHTVKTQTENAGTY